MNKRNLEFYLEYGGNRVQVTPYYKKLEKKTTKEAGQEFYRASLQGQIKFVGKDFLLIYNEPIGTEFTLAIWQDVENSKQLYYRGIFTKIDCKFDIAKQIVEPKFKTADFYTKILDKYKDEFDLIKLVIPSQPIRCSKRPFIQIYCAGTNAVTNIHNGKSWETDVSVSIAEEQEIKKYGFNNVVTFREIRIAGAGEESVNGLYTKHDYFEAPDNDEVAYYVHRWYKVENSINTHFIELRSSYMHDGSIIFAGIFSVAGGEAIYEANPDNLPYDIMFNQKGSLANLVFTNKSSSSDFATVTEDFLYDIFGRILHNNQNKGADIKIDDFAISNVSYKYSAHLEDMRFFISSDSTITKTPYGVNDNGEYFTDTWLPNLAPTDKFLPMARSAWANTSLWFAYEKSKIDNIDSTYTIDYTLRDAFNIGHVIKALLAEIDISLRHDLTAEYSQFLYDNSFLLPDMQERFYIYITQKTNMIKGIYDQAAQTAKVSLETIMNMLRDCFRCYWYIDAFGNFKIEHILYFIKGRSYVEISPYLDLNIYKDQFNKKGLLYRQETLAYNADDLNGNYTFSFADDSFLPFTGIELKVNNPYVKKDKTENINVGEFSADVDYMQISSDAVIQDGFALLCPILREAATGLISWYELPFVEVQLVENGKPYTIMVQNGYASWDFLINFYAFDMPGSKVVKNEDISFNVKGLKENLIQTIETPFISNLLPYMLLKTSLGIARIVEISENLDTGHLSLNLVYPMA